MSLLAVEDLHIEFAAGNDASVAHAVDGISFGIDAGATLGIVGESGCGKSVTALSLLGLLPPPPACRVRGRALFDGKNLYAQTVREWNAVRGKEIGMVFQEPMTALNPVLSIGAQIAESVLLHEPGITPGQARARAEAMIAKVGIADAARRFDEYPHQMSGGMRQRCLIAMALACRPRLLVADEPTTALDVTVQAQILELVLELQAEMGMAVLWISHDLGVIAEVADEVLVMYAGQVVEKASATAFFGEPLHPYARGLMSSVPRPPGEDEAFSRLQAIPGSVPEPTARPSGCFFRERCAEAITECAATCPPLEPKRPGHWARCLKVIPKS